MPCVYLNDVLQSPLAAAADDLIQLLLLAREHAVEPAVLACLQRLEEKVDLHNMLLHHLSWLC